MENITKISEKLFPFLFLQGWSFLAAACYAFLNPFHAEYFYLSVTSYINCIVARCLINIVYLTACCLYQVMMTLHFLSDVTNDAESTQKSKITS